MRTNVLVCFNNNDCIVTWINCSLQEAKDYYIGTSFDGKIGMTVIDTDKTFQVTVNGLTYDYKFKGINYDIQVDFRIVLENLTLNESTEVEPQWFYASDKRIITQ